MNSSQIGFITNHRLFAINLPSEPVLNQVRVEVRGVNGDASGSLENKECEN
jgi:hypothetical protein